MRRHETEADRDEVRGARSLKSKLAEGRPRSGELGRILALARPQLPAILLSLMLLAGYTGLGLIVPLAVAELLDGVLATAGAADLVQLDRFALALVGIFSVRALLLGLHTYLLARAGGRIVMCLRRELYDHLLELGPEFYDDRRVGGLVSRVISDVAQVQAVVTSDLAVAASSALTFVGAWSILIWRSWRLSLLLMGVVPPLILISWAYGRSMRRRGEAIQDRTADAAASVEESLGSIRLVQAFVREPFEQGRFGRAAEGLYAAVMDRVRLNAIVGSLVSFLTLSMLSLGLWLGGREVLAGRMSAGDLIAYLIYTAMLGSSSSALVSLYGRWANALGSSRRVFALIDTEPAVRSPALPDPLGEVAGAIRFERMSFAYRPGITVLGDIDLEIAPGETLALVGPSGAGKSTLMHLVARYYDPDRGRVLIDGKDLRSLNLTELRRQIGLVPQDTVLFNATVAENLRYGRLEADIDALEIAATQANAHDFIAALPDAYDSLVGERGIRLSAGQRQRIAIARALLANPRILLLDEATASLDSESEQLVQSALERLMRGRTTLVIAHRLSTVRKADRIAVIDAGRIVELGKHTELIEAGGLYARLSRIQFGPDRVDE